MSVDMLSVRSRKNLEQVAEHLSQGFLRGMRGIRCDCGFRAVAHRGVTLRRVAVPGEATRTLWCRRAATGCASLASGMMPTSQMPKQKCCPTRSRPLGHFRALFTRHGLLGQNELAIAEACVNGDATLREEFPC